MFLLTCDKKLTKSQLSPVCIGVRQAGVLSPILFCVYIDNLLDRLSRSGVGCYLGINFVGALMQMISCWSILHHLLCVKCCQFVMPLQWNMTLNSMLKNLSD